jgi:hypothetical protein
MNCSDVAYVKADFFSVEFTADFWYLSVVTGANEHQSRPPTIAMNCTTLVSAVLLEQYISPSSGCTSSLLLEQHMYWISFVLELCSLPLPIRI